MENSSLFYIKPSQIVYPYYLPSKSEWTKNNNSEIEKKFLNWFKKEKLIDFNMRFLLVFCSMCGLVAVAKADENDGEWILSSQNCCRWQNLTLLVEVFIVTFSIDVEPHVALRATFELFSWLFWFWKYVKNSESIFFVIKIEINWQTYRMRVGWMFSSSKLYLIFVNI